MLLLMFVAVVVPTVLGDADSCSVPYCNLEALIDNMDAKHIENNLRYLTSQPHVAGTSADFEQADYLQKLWTQQGLDQVALSPYQVLLSFPHTEKSSKVSISDSNGAVKFTSSLREDDKFNEDILPAYNAYSASGSIESEKLIYANYGRYEDFLRLEKEFKIPIKGLLVIVRYGKFFRGDKVLNAQRFGAAGVILYSDPADYSSPDEAQTPNYPHSWWLPGDGIQRGTIVWRDGDPSTPLYPALDGVFRVSEDEMDVPRIPVHPIGFNDARKVFMQMDGAEAPEDWRGALNATYRLGPQLRTSGWKVKLEVHNIRKLATTYNVIGFIRGRTEPDRYVIYGNHRDAWTFGSVDPSSATATLMELVRSYSILLHQGWRPRRSILFCSWGGSEQGYMGSTEWLEEHLSLLGARTVAHLNVDIAIIDNYNLLAVGSPLLHQLMIDSARNVPAPDPALNFTTLLDHWKGRRTFTGSLVGAGFSGSVSDHAPFYQRLGIPCTYFLWMPDPQEWPNADYPLYHSSYETFEAVKRFLDPDFSYHLALGRLWAVLGLSLADSPLLPFRPDHEAETVRNLIDQLEQSYDHVIRDWNIQTDHLRRAADGFVASATDFQHRIEHLDYSDALRLRIINDQLLQVEKAFVYSEGLPRRPHMKNVMYGTSIFDQYASSMLPGVEEALIHLSLADESTPVKPLVNEVQHQIGIVTSVIRAAAKILADVDIW